MWFMKEKGGVGRAVVGWGRGGGGVGEGGGGIGKSFTTMGEEKFLSFYLKSPKFWQTS